MLKIISKFAWRNLIKNKVSSFINIGGLAIGMAVAMLIALWIYDELSLINTIKLQSHCTGDATNNLEGRNIDGRNIILLPVSSQLRSSFSGDFEHVATSTWTEEHILAFGENKFNQSGNFMEKDGPEILTLEMVRGTESRTKRNKFYPDISNFFKKTFRGR